MNNVKIKRYLSLAAASRSVTTGFDLVLGEVRRSKDVLVLLSSDASDRTKKQITDKCVFYGVKLIPTDINSDELGACVGKKSPAAAVAVKNKGLATEIEKAASDGE